MYRNCAIYFSIRAAMNSAAMRLENVQTHLRQLFTICSLERDRGIDSFALCAKERELQKNVTYFINYNY